jgi:hypothetical protein
MSAKDLDLEKKLLLPVNQGDDTTVAGKII